METQKIANLLNDSEKLNSKFATRKWYIYSAYMHIDAYILVTGNTTVTGGNANTKDTFKNCALFRRAVVHINDEHIKMAENLDIIILMYNLIQILTIMEILLEVCGNSKEMNKI